MYSLNWQDECQDFVEWSLIGITTQAHQPYPNLKFPIEWNQLLWGEYRFLWVLKYIQVSLVHNFIRLIIDVAFMQKFIYLVIDRYGCGML